MFITACNERENSPQSLYDIRLTVLPRDAMRKRGLCCLSVHLSRNWCILSTWLKISSYFFLRPVTKFDSGLVPSALASVLPSHLYVRGAASADSSRTCSESLVFFFGNITRNTRPCVQKILHRFWWQFRFRRVVFFWPVVGELVCRRVGLSASCP